MREWTVCRQIKTSSEACTMQDVAKECSRLTNKEIARELEISVRTAKFHVCNLLNKLGLENRRNLLEGFGTVEST
jgi:FixJ family two-component response regulator